MAVLKSTSRRRRELEVEESLRLAKLRLARSKQVLFQYDAHMQAYRDHLIQSYTGKTKTFQAGREIKARWPGDRDYRSFAPKGIVLVAPRLKGEHARFGVN